MIPKEVSFVIADVTTTCQRGVGIFCRVPSVRGQGRHVPRFPLRYGRHRAIALASLAQVNNAFNSITIGTPAWGTPERIATNTAVRVFVLTAKSSSRPCTLLRFVGIRPTCLSQYHDTVTSLFFIAELAMAVLCFAFVFILPN